MWIVVKETEDFLPLIINPELQQSVQYTNNKYSLYLLTEEEFESVRGSGNAGKGAPLAPHILKLYTIVITHVLPAISPRRRPRRNNFSVVEELVQLERYADCGRLTACTLHAAAGTSGTFVTARKLRPPGRPMLTAYPNPTTLPMHVGRM